MRWIAAGALLMDTERAAGLTFRALMDDPSRTDAAIVGLSPEFELEPIVGANVIDLERRTTSDIQPSDSSLARVAAFLDGMRTGTPGVRPRGAVGVGRRSRARRPGGVGAARRHPDGRGVDPRRRARRSARRCRRERRAAATRIRPSSPRSPTGHRARPTRSGPRGRPATGCGGSARPTSPTVLDRVSRDGPGAAGDQARRRARRTRPRRRAVRRQRHVGLVGRRAGRRGGPSRGSRPPSSGSSPASSGPRRWPASSSRSRPGRSPSAARSCPRDNLLVAAWLRHQGIDARLAAIVRNGVGALRGGQGTSDASYDELLDAALHAPYFGADFPDEELAELVDRVRRGPRAHPGGPGPGGSDRANTTLKPLLDDLADWGPAVAPHLGSCLLDAVDARAVEYVASEAGTWASDGVRLSLRGRFATNGKSDVALHALKLAGGSQSVDGGRRAPIPDRGREVVHADPYSRRMGASGARSPGRPAPIRRTRPAARPQRAVRQSQGGLTCCSRLSLHGGRRRRIIAVVAGAVVGVVLPALSFTRRFSSARDHHARRGGRGPGAHGRRSGPATGSDGTGPGRSTCRTRACATRPPYVRARWRSARARSPSPGRCGGGPVKAAAAPVASRRHRRVCGSSCFSRCWRACWSGSRSRCWPGTSCSPWPGARSLPARPSRS